jgi:hypothetical protein
MHLQHLNFLHWASREVIQVVIGSLLIKRYRQNNQTDLASLAKMAFSQASRGRSSDASLAGYLQDTLWVDNYHIYTSLRD